MRYKRIIVLAFTLFLAAIFLFCFISEMQGRARIQANALADQPKFYPTQRGVQRDSLDSRVTLIKTRQEINEAVIAESRADIKELAKMQALTTNNVSILVVGHAFLEEKLDKLVWGVGSIVLLLLGQLASNFSKWVVVKVRNGKS